MLGWTHRNNRLHLVLVLPDGSRSLIPAAWTDLTAALAPRAHPMSLGALADLLHARTLVDANS